MPFAWASKGPSAGSAAARRASASIGATTGAAATFAGMATSGICRKCSHEIGAVASPHAAESATGSRVYGGSG